MTVGLQERSPKLGLLTGLAQKFPKAKTLDLFRKICFNRFFELETARVYPTGVMKIPIYLSLGQEQISAAISVVKKDFLIFAQHRCHSYYLSFGGDPRRLVDEL